MIVYRHAPKNRPFIWENDEQPAGRWHDAGEGPVHYFADTPDGAWAEFLRHAEVDQADELERIQRVMWAIEIDEQPVKPDLPYEILTGGEETYPACQDTARRLRLEGTRSVVAPSAALRPGGARGMQTNIGLQPGPERSGFVFVVFEPLPEVVGWMTGTSTVPSYVALVYQPL